MNRRVGLKRRTPLRARTALTRKAVGRHVRPTGPLPEVVDLVLERAQYSCELCLVGLGPTRGIGWALHHRRPRRIGGSRRADTNSPANLLALCAPCHEVIEVQRAVAYEGGWLLHAGDDPAVHPVLIGADRWLYLAPDGAYALSPPP